MSAPGRPRLASREILQEAAFELFQMQGYRGTSVEQITKTTGFSRATFFNFFSSKAELFWIETDTLAARLRAHLETHAQSKQPPSLTEALLDFASGLKSADIPWALQNFRLIDASDDLVASGASRVLELYQGFAGYLASTSNRSDTAKMSSAALQHQAHAGAVVAKLLVALTAWIDAGVSRSELATYLHATL